MIGNTRTCAVVSKRGCVEWFCAPRFDSPSMFASLLDREEGGRFSVTPLGGIDRISRRYVGDTAVLETTFHTGEGVLRLTDCMPLIDEEARARRPWPEHQILRRIECVEGSGTVEIVFDPRPDYGRADPAIEDHGPLGLWCHDGSEAISLVADCPLALETGERAARGRVDMEAGEERWLSLTYASREPLVLLAPADEGPGLLESTLTWWQEWADRCEYEGRWRDEVVRSAITLKLLTYAPSGAIVAAGTTSLPEVPGGDKNWDYRYCWPRDASWTLRALFALGYPEEAEAFFDWILYAVRLHFPHVEPIYDLHGNRHLDEYELEHFEGWNGARPVRIGNGAANQLQLDALGSVVLATFEHVDHGAELDSGDRAFLTGLGEEICRRWQERGQGIWELRGDGADYTYSKVMCWAALDRILKLEAWGVLDAEDIPKERFIRNRDMIRDEIETRAWMEEDGCYSGMLDGRLYDAAVLRMTTTGYVQATDERMRSTYERLTEVLGTEDGLLYRYAWDPDDVPPDGEGTFGLASFWAVTAAALAGDEAGATERLESILGYASDVGLFTEMIEPGTGRHLGNFPQAFTHLGLIDAVLTLESVARGREATVTTPWEHQDAPEGEAARHGGGRVYVDGAEAEARDADGRIEPRVINVAPGEEPPEEADPAELESIDAPADADARKDRRSDGHGERP